MSITSLDFKRVIGSGNSVNGTAFMKTILAPCKNIVFHGKHVVVSALTLVISGCAFAPSADYSASPQYHDGHFHNGNLTDAESLPHPRDLLNFFTRRITTSAQSRAPATPIPIQVITREALTLAPDNSAWRLGHSTVLLKINHRFWLTDPVFSDRASPFSFVGPKRFHAPPILIQDLPPIAGVIISHDHYDHLDRDSIMQLQTKATRFYTPLGVGERLVGWGVSRDKVTQLDWWQSVSAGSVTLTATPSQHFSGRTPWDRNSTLWASWVIQSDEARVYFSGDSGYFSGFTEIGKRYGPFDLTLIETGAYDSAWPTVHMQPENSLRAHMDLGGRQFMPIHNSTFDLAFHSWRDPLDRIQVLSRAEGVTLVTPLIGEKVNITEPNFSSTWWR